MKVTVVINEQHALLEDQERILRERFGKQIELLKVPAKGWDIEQIRSVAWEQIRTPHLPIVFASPVPALLLLLAQAGKNVSVFHNDDREAREVPDGRGGTKIIHTIAKTGWILV